MSVADTDTFGMAIADDDHPPAPGVARVIVSTSKQVDTELAELSGLLAREIGGKNPIAVVMVKTIKVMYKDTREIRDDTLDGDDLDDIAKEVKQLREKYTQLKTWHTRLQSTPFAMSARNPGAGVATITGADAHQVFAAICQAVDNVDALTSHLQTLVSPVPVLPPVVRPNPGPIVYPYNPGPDYGSGVMRPSRPVSPDRTNRPDLYSGRNRYPEPYPRYDVEQPHEWWGGSDRYDRRYDSRYDNRTYGRYGERDLYGRGYDSRDNYSVRPYTPPVTRPRDDYRYDDRYDRSDDRGNDTNYGPSLLPQQPVGPSAYDKRPRANDRTSQRTEERVVFGRRPDGTYGLMIERRD